MHRWHPSLVLYRKTKLTLHAEHYSFHVRNQQAHLCMQQRSSRGLPVPVGDHDVINISSIKRATRPSMTELNPPRTRRRKSNFTAACAKLTRRRRRCAATGNYGIIASPCVRPLFAQTRLSATPQQKNGALKVSNEHTIPLTAEPKALSSPPASWSRTL